MKKNTKKEKQKKEMRKKDILFKLGVYFIVLGCVKLLVYFILVKKEKNFAEKKAAGIAV